MKNLKNIVSIIVLALLISSINNAYGQNYINLSEKTIERVAKKHNEYLEIVFNNLNYNDKNLKKEIISEFNKIKEKELIDNSNKVKIKEKFDINLEKNVNNIDENLKTLKEKLSKEAFLIIMKAYSLSNKRMQISKFKKEINKLELNAKEKLKGVELDTVLITLNVFKQSAYFWFPESDGGSGKGYAILKKIKSYKSATNVLAANGLSAGSSFIGGALAAGIFGGPLGWGFLAGVAISSAMSSAIEAL